MERECELHRTDSQRRRSYGLLAGLRQVRSSVASKRDLFCTSGRAVEARSHEASHWTGRAPGMQMEAAKLVQNVAMLAFVRARLILIHRESPTARFASIGDRYCDRSCRTLPGFR